MAPRQPPTYSAYQINPGVPAWFTNSKPYDLYGEIERLQTSRANSDLAQIKERQAQAALGAMDILGNQGAADPYAEASALLEQTLQSDLADKVRNRNTEKTLTDIESATKMNDAGFEDLAKSYLSDRGYDVSAIKKKKEYRQFDPNKDFYEIGADGTAVIVKPGVKKEKADKASPTIMFNLDGDSMVVDKNDRVDLARAESEGFVFDKPVDPVMAQLMRRNRERLAEERSIKEQSQPAPAPVPAPTPQVEYYRRRR